MKTKYYYDVRTIDGHPGSYFLKEAMNRAVAEGWDVFQLLPSHSGAIVHLIVRRPVNEQDED